jgi:hypothetical protein
MPPVLPELDSQSFPVQVESDENIPMLISSEMFKQEHGESADQDNAVPRKSVTEGMVGKLLIRKSGKVQMEMGNVFFDVRYFTRCLLPKNGQCFHNWNEYMHQISPVSNFRTFFTADHRSSPILISSRYCCD